MSGAIPYAVGQSTIVRIPIPGTDRLAVEFRPRGRLPPSGRSSSTLFFQDPTGRRHLRLDYGYNASTRTVNYHWNQRGTHQSFGIGNHQPAGPGASFLHHGAKYYRYAGRVLLVVGVAVDVVSIVQASRPLRRASQVVAGWAGAWAGCKTIGAGGAAVGSIKPGLGTAIGGIAGCVIGGVGGYIGGSTVAGLVYDWAEETFFTPLPEVSAAEASGLLEAR
jgi:hypothetical protein